MTWYSIPVLICGLVLQGALACRSYASVVVVDDNVTFSRSGNTFGFRVSKTAEDFEGSDGTYAEFADFTHLQSILGTGSSADEGSDWYVVQPGDLFSRATVAAGQFPLVLSILSGPQPPVHVGSGDFYLGVRTGIDPEPPY
jgi:hypothetical protein